MKQGLWLKLLLILLILNSCSSKYGSMVDARNGLVYETVKIGKQEWMQDNLSVDRFRNGELINHAKTDDEWLAAD